MSKNSNKLDLYKSYMKTNIKLYTLKLLNIVLDIKDKLAKKSLDISTINNIDKVYIPFINLGIGDLIMLSPTINLLCQEYQNKEIIIITNQTKLFDIDNLTWKKPNDKEILKDYNKNSIVISLTLSWYHIKYMYNSNFHIGYFLSNRLTSNFIGSDFKYQPKTEHYINKSLTILDLLSIKYDKENLIYPKLLSDDNWVSNKADASKDKNQYNNYIAVAPYSNWRERQYSIEKYIDLIYDLSVYHKIILIGNNDDDELKFNNHIYKAILDKTTLLLDVSCETNKKDNLNTPNMSRIINLTGETSLYQVIDIIRNSTLYIGNDSGTSNIAFVEAKKSITFFGSVLPNNRIPLNQNLKNNIKTYHRKDLCDIYPCYDGFNKPNCQFNYKCLDFDIDIDDIIDFINQSQHKHKQEN